MKEFTKIYNSNIITLSRALFALCFLVTLVFTPLRDLFPVQHILFLKENIYGLNHLNFFLWFDNLLIPYFFSISILIISILGIYPRYIIIIQSWVSYSIYYSMLVTEGGDQINIIIVFLLIPIVILDKRKNGWNIREYKLEMKKNNLLLYNSYLALFFIKIQIALLYFNAGVAKIYAPEWANGTAVYYWFYDSVFGAPIWLDYMVGFLFKNKYTVSLINWGVIVLEIFLFVGLFLKQKWKYLIFIGAFFFHFMIFLIHGLPAFWVSMTGCLTLYLLRLDLTIKENINEMRYSVLNLFNYVKE